MTDAAEMIDIAGPIVGPTPGRLSHARGLELDLPVVDQRVVRRSTRIFPAVETMRKQGKINDGQWSAYERFEADWNTAGIGLAVVAKYGERAGGGGTPAMHLCARAFDAIESRDVARSLAVSRLEAALVAVHVPRLCRALLLAMSAEHGLEAIGRAISRFHDRGKAIAVAGTALEDALCLLDQHYSRLHGQSQIAP